MKRQTIFFAVIYRRLFVFVLMRNKKQIKNLIRRNETKGEITRIDTQSLIYFSIQIIIDVSHGACDGIYKYSSPTLSENKTITK